MKEQIVGALEDIERMESINIIYACESGSRMWGFASPNSDYDVRFIYARKPEDYFTVYPYRDVIDRNKGNERTSEYIRSLEKKDIDIIGFDVKKVMHLISKCNPGVSEWLSSCIIYMENPQAWLPIQSISNETFKFVAAINHYVNLAKIHFSGDNEIMNNSKVSLKQYLYVLRSILACQYINLYKQYPPAEINEMYSNPRLFDDGFHTIINICEVTERFVQKKIHTPEKGLVESVTELNYTISILIKRYETMVAEKHGEQLSMDMYAKIDKTFFDIVNKWALL